MRARAARHPLVTVWALALLVGVGCRGDGVGERQDLLVSAAASLSDAFADIETAFEDSNPGVDVLLNLGGSSTLRVQILEGAPTDVFASANISNMQEVVEAGELAGEPRIFAGNLLQIAVPAGNPAGVTGLEDFGDDALLIGLCAEDVPCGDLAREVLANAGVVPSLDSNEPDVRALLTKIEQGELDAGITYITDVASTDGAVEGIAIHEDLNARADYLIAALAGASDPETAAAFIDFVLSEEGQDILTEFGFVSP